jgi:hypothetical protein
LNWDFSLGDDIDDARSLGEIEQRRLNYLDNRNVNPPQVFDFNLDALDKILRPMLDQNHPGEGGNHEEG